MVRKLSDRDVIAEFKRRSKIHEAQLKRHPLGRDAKEERAGILTTIEDLRRAKIKRPSLSLEIDDVIEELQSL